MKRPENISNYLEQLSSSEIHDKIKKQQAYKNFWEGIDEHYFSNPSEIDRENLNNLISELEKPIKGKIICHFGNKSYHFTNEIILKQFIILKFQIDQNELFTIS